MTDWKTKYETLVRLLNAAYTPSPLYPIGYLTKGQRNDHEIKKADAYKIGWNDRGFAELERLGKIMTGAEEGMSDDMTMLLAADVGCFDDGKLSLNMNDTWAWATGWSVTVEPEQLKEVARLFRSYGHAGLMYWHSCREKNMRSEFLDNNRAVDFVRHEEEIRRDTPDHNKRAYKQVAYTLGLPETGGK